MFSHILASLKTRLRTLLAPPPLPLIHPTAARWALQESDANFVATDMFILTGMAAVANGAWCWFQDPRALVDTHSAEGPALIVSSVSTTVDEQGLPRGANNISIMPLEGGDVRHHQLEASLTRDDHNAAALYQREDHRTVAVYTDHGHETQSYGAISGRDHDQQWTPLPSVTHRARVSYSNLFRAGENRLFNFTRSVGWNPNFLLSENAGESWEYGGRLLKGEGRPYIQYAQGAGAVHFIATEQHPRDHANSIYHGIFDGVEVMSSDGQVTCDDIAGTGGISPERLTKIFQGSEEQVAWTVDITVDAEGYPVVIFSTRNGDDGVPAEKQGMDIRYHYARFDGAEWRVNELAHAGTRLYAEEADYSGLAAIDPEAPGTVVISTNADPVTGAPLISTADEKRHWELFRGQTQDGGRSWTWQPLTANSTSDNIRPVIPSWPEGRRVILWMRGTYRSYKDWNTQIVGIQQDR
ncbi:MAG: BNR-4 repeat-containing protein [Pseudomonadota bacterium]